MANVFDNPATNVYDAYGKAVAAGQLYNDTLRRNTAFNALSKVYGPETGDPKLAADMEALHQSKQMDPLLVDQQSLQNAGTAQANVFAKQNDPLIVKGNEITNATNQNTLDQTQKIQKAAQVHGALSTSISTLGTQLQGVTDPNQRLQLFDAQIEQVAPLLGVDSATLKSQLAQARAAVATQGADALPQIQQQLDASVNANLTPAERVQLQQQQTNLAIQDSKLQEQQAKTEAVKKNGGLTGAQQIAQEKIDIAQKAKADAAYAALNSFGDTVNEVAAPGGAIDTAIAFIQAHPDSYGFVAKGVMGHGAIDVADSNAYKLAQLLAPITSNAVLGKLQELKKTSPTGASGFGQLSDREGEYLKTAGGSIDQGQSGTAIIAGLMKYRDAMNRSQGRLTQAYKSAYGDVPQNDPNAPPAAAAPHGGDTPPQPGGGAGQVFTYNAATGELE